MDYSLCRFFYGTDTQQRDVTHIVLQQCLNEFGHIEFFHPMNSLFGDVCPFKPKKLFCKSADGITLQIINEQQTAFPIYRLACFTRITPSSEWLNHYITEGVQQFYVMHHGTVNDSLRSYIQQGLVKLFSKPDLILAVVQNETEWLMCCDSDTIITSNGQTIVDTLISLPLEVSVTSVRTHRIYRTRDMRSLP